MSWFPRPVGPRAAFSDLGAFLRQRSREQMIGATLAILVTIIIMILFFVDSKINTAPPARIIYVESFSANRTDAEIIAQQKIDSEAKRAYQEEKRRQFQKIDEKLSGL